MDLQNINFKVFAADPQSVHQELFTPIFQAWIQNQVTGELLLDVADYLHVPQGPGIVLIGNEADYSMDDTEGRLGLRYNRKAALGGKNSERFSQALKATLQACLRLEADPKLGGQLKFKRDELELFVNDRAQAPNTPETAAACSADIQGYFEKLLGGQKFSVAYQKDPRERFGATIKTEAPLDFEGLLKKI